MTGEWDDINTEYQESPDVRPYFPIKVRLSDDSEVVFQRPEDIPRGTIFEVIEVHCA